MPHIAHQTRPEILALKAQFKGCKIADLTQDPIKILKQISASERVISSSLHGLICADSLGVENIRLNLGSGLKGGNFKFDDYDTSIGRSINEITGVELQADINNIFSPSDIVDRGGCLVCDLNQEIPNLEQYDTVFLSGVIEYINDVSELLNVISSASGVKTVIVSYATKEKNRRRLSQGWVNSYSKDEFEFLFNDRGFSISHQDSWQKQNIYKFTRNKTC